MSLKTSHCCDFVVEPREAFLLMMYLFAMLQKIICVIKCASVALLINKHW
jgi:hypothetical protein